MGDVVRTNLLSGYYGVSVLIKTAIKHWIYETCIDTVFSGIARNFRSPELTYFYDNIKVGDWYTYITISDNINFDKVTECRKCEITFVDGEYISFRCDTATAYTKEEKGVHQTTVTENVLVADQITNIRALGDLIEVTRADDGVEEKCLDD
jgi:hypothetical protein